MENFVGIYRVFISFFSPDPVSGLDVGVPYEEFGNGEVGEVEYYVKHWIR